MSALNVTARLWDTHSNRLVEQHWSASIAPTQAQILGQLAPPDDIATSVFCIELTLRDKNNNRLDRNVYWLSTTPDQLGVDTAILQQANYHELNNLPSSNIIVHYAFSNQGPSKKLIAKIENKTSHISFFNRLMVKTQQNTSIAPIDWSDNFITLFPHQSETITAYFNEETLQGETPFFAVEGINSTFEMYPSP